MLKNKKHHLIVEGNIGAGKSTFVRILTDFLQAHPVYEPHEKWQNVPNGGGNLLEAFYKDIKRWAYTFQSYAFVTRVLEQERAEKEAAYDFLVEERSVYSDRLCFAKNCYEMGLMSELEWSLYKEWFSWLVEGYTHKPSGFIYLRVNPETCYKRVKLRSRGEETSVGLDYLEKIHNKHDNWLQHKEELFPFLKDVPVLVLDTNGDFENDELERQKLIKKVADFYNIPLKLDYKFEKNSIISL